MSRLFLDANIVRDLIEERQPFCKDAALLFAEAYHKRVQFTLSKIPVMTASEYLAMLK